MEPSPFTDGGAQLEARARVSVLPLNRCLSPVDLFTELFHRRGACLMESAARGEKAGTRSLVIPEGVIRLQVRGGEARFRALRPSARPLLSALPGGGAGRVSEDVVRLRFHAAAPDPATAEDERLTAPSVLDAVRALARLVRDETPGAAPAPGAYGALSFELVDRWEDLPPRAPDPWNEPDVDMVLALDAILYDHRAGEVRVVTRSVDREADREADDRHREYLSSLQYAGGTGEGECEVPPARAVGEKEAEADVTDEEFLASVRKFLLHIERGDIFQGVLSRGYSMTSAASSLAVYRALRRENPSPYMFHVDLARGVLLGSSPETCLKVEGRRVEIRPIAGTAPRGIRGDGGIDPELDSRLAIGLLLDPKEQAEHAMLVDLARNDVARVALPGTRRVEEAFAIERYSHVQHLVSAVSGELRPALDALHAYRAAANMGTLTGAPKLRAMELIRETEPFARGFYGGAVGYLLEDGTFDSCIAIRSLRGFPGQYLTRAGAGIVAESVPQRELQETLHKARAVRRAVALAEAPS